MYAHVQLQREIRLHPRYFGPTIDQKLMAMVREDVEGTVYGNYGLVLMVVSFYKQGGGLLTPGRFSSYLA